MMLGAPAGVPALGADTSATNFTIGVAPCRDQFGRLTMGVPTATGACAGF
jgi:hypothetical protein